MPHTDADHNDPNYEHTTEDLITHEVDAFMSNLRNLYFKDVLDLSFTPTQHCEQCAEQEDEKTIEFLAEMNECLDEIRDAYVAIRSLANRRVELLLPRILAATHDEASRSPFDPGTLDKE